MRRKVKTTDQLGIDKDGGKHNIDNNGALECCGGEEFMCLENCDGNEDWCNVRGMREY
jgi:hypothetical protein